MTRPLTTLTIFIAIVAVGCKDIPVVVNYPNSRGVYYIPMDCTSAEIYSTRDSTFIYIDGRLKQSIKNNYTK